MHEKKMDGSVGGVVDGIFDCGVRRWFGDFRKRLGG